MKTKRLTQALAAAAFAIGTSLAHAADIVDTAVAAGQFDTLVKAVKAAGLVEVLKGKGPFTVFARTDQAFEKVPKKQLEALLKDKKQLQAVLKYHVVPGKVTAAHVVKLNDEEGQEVGRMAFPLGEDSD